jgi:hypothetical protein
MRWFWLILAAAIGLAGWIYFIPTTAITGGLGFGDNPAEQKSLQYLTIAFGYCVTLAGVFLGSAYRELQRRRASGSTTISGVLEFLKSVTSSIDFWLGLCGSPLVYALILQGVDSNNMAGLVVIALQNGFTCTVAIDAISKGQQQRPAASPGGGPS